MFGFELDHDGNARLMADVVCSLMLYQLDSGEAATGFMTKTLEIGLTFDGRDFGHFRSMFGCLTNLSWAMAKKRLPEPWSVVIINQEENVEAYDTVG